MHRNIQIDVVYLLKIWSVIKHLLNWSEQNFSYLDHCAHFKLMFSFFTISLTFNSFFQVCFQCIDGDCFKGITSILSWFILLGFFWCNKFCESEGKSVAFSANSNCLSLTTALCLTEFLFVSKRAALVGVKVLPFCSSKSAVEGFSVKFMSN